MMRRGNTWPLRLVAAVLLNVVMYALLPAQGYDRFNLFLDLNFESADRTLELYTGLGGNPSTIAGLKGSRIALATTGLIARRSLSVPDLESALQAAKFNQGLSDDVFRMKDARTNVDAIRELLTELRRRNFGQKVVSTVQQLFPPDTRLSVRIPVFFVAFGHENIDAFVRRVVWHGNEPVFVGEGEGELTIVVNLAKAVHYGSTVDERFVGVISVVAHEVFHAAFGAYKDESPVWRSYYASQKAPIDYLLDLTQNEGIAYYLTLVQRTHGRLIADWAPRSRAAMEEFNRRAEEIMQPSVSSRRATEIIQMANTSGYWESYGSIAGMIIARQIDRTLGSQALAETIARGPADFFQKYAEALARSSDAPPLSEKVLEYARSMRY